MALSSHGRSKLASALLALASLGAATSVGCGTDAGAERVGPAAITAFATAQAVPRSTHPESGPTLEAIGPADYAAGRAIMEADPLFRDITSGRFTVVEQVGWWEAGGVKAGVAFVVEFAEPFTGQRTWPSLTYDDDDGIFLGYDSYTAYVRDMGAVIVQADLRLGRVVSLHAAPSMPAGMGR